MGLCRCGFLGRQRGTAQAIAESILRVSIKPIAPLEVRRREESPNPVSAG